MGFISIGQHSTSKVSSLINTKVLAQVTTDFILRILCLCCRFERPIYCLCSERPVMPFLFIDLLVFCISRAKSVTSHSLEMYLLTTLDLKQQELGLDTMDQSKTIVVYSLELTVTGNMLPQPIVILVVVYRDNVAFLTKRKGYLLYLPMNLTYCYSIVLCFFFLSHCSSSQVRITLYSL